MLAELAKQTHKITPPYRGFTHFIPIKLFHAAPKKQFESISTWAGPQKGLILHPTLASQGIRNCYLLDWEQGLNHPLPPDGTRILFHSYEHSEAEVEAAVIENRLIVVGDKILEPIKTDWFLPQTSLFCVDYHPGEY